MVRAFSVFIYITPRRYSPVVVFVVVVVVTVVAFLVVVVVAVAAQNASTAGWICAQCCTRGCSPDW